CTQRRRGLPPDRSGEHRRFRLHCPPLYIPALSLKSKITLAQDGGTIMAIKVLIYRKIKPGKEKELSEAVRALRFKAMVAQGYISGETLRSVEDPSIQLVISTWKSIEDWNNWFNTRERQAFEEKIDVVLEEPTKIAPYEYESFLVHADETLSSLEFAVEGE